MDYREMQDRRFQSSLGRLNYRYNDGESDTALLLLHGFAVSSLSWSRFIERLPESTTVIAPDLLGHGGSEAPDIEYTVMNHVKSIKELAASFAGRRITIMGHSYGGWIAALLAAEGGLDRLVLEDPAGLDLFMDERFASNPDYNRILIKEALVTNPNERVVRSSVYSRKPEEQLSCEKLGMIKIPSLIIWGEGDLMIPARFAETFRSCIKSSSLFIVQGAKHAPHYTNPDAVAEKVLGFMG